MRVYVPVPESPVYSKLLFALASGEGYSSQLSNKLGKTQATIFTQLQYLEKKGYVKSKYREDNYKNIKLFEVNWSKIVQDFFKYIYSKSQVKNFSISDKYLHNKYLILHLQEAFSNYKKFGLRNNIITDIFECFTYSLLEGDMGFTENTKPKELGEYYELFFNINGIWGNRKFMDFSEKVFDKFAKDIPKPTKEEIEVFNKAYEIEDKERKKAFEEKLKEMQRQAKEGTGRAY